MKKVQELHIPQQNTCIVNIFEVVDFLIKNESYSIVCIVASYGDDSYCRLGQNELYHSPYYSIVL